MRSASGARGRDAFPAQFPGRGSRRAGTRDGRGFGILRREAGFAVAAVRAFSAVRAGACELRAEWGHDLVVDRAGGWILGGAPRAHGIRDGPPLRLVDRPDLTSAVRLVRAVRASPGLAPGGSTAKAQVSRLG